MDKEKMLHALAEEKIQRGKYLAESKYGKYNIPVFEYMEKKKRPVSENMRASIGYCMENFEQSFYQRLSANPFLLEASAGATTSKDVKFINWAFQLMSALMPNLIADQIFSVQPMDRRVGQIFYLDVEAASNKGAVKIGDKLATVETGFNADPSYPLQIIDGEEMATGDGGAAYSFTHQYVPVIETTVVYSAIATDDSEMQVVDNGSGTFTGDGTGTINYNSGAVAITFAKNVKVGELITAKYEFRMDLMPEKTPKVKISIQDKFIRAIFASLGAIWVLHAGYDLQKAQGISARDVLLETQAGLLRRAIDHYLLQLIYNKAAGTPITFAKTAPTGVNKKDHYDSFRYILAEQSQNIGRQTKMNAGNLIIAGHEAHIIISGLEGYKVKTDVADAPQGPIISGTYNQYTVVYDPEYPANDWIMGYKGPTYLNQNFIYCPYMPFFTSEVTWLNFFEGHQGTGTAFASHTVRPQGFSKGTILLS